MAEPLLRALSRVRSVLLDESGLIRAVASGRQRSSAPNWRRVELRYVDLNAGRRLQEVRYDATQAFTANYAPGEQSRDAIDALLDEPFGNWHVETTDSVIQLRVTKRGEAVVSQKTRAAALPDRTHDRAKPRLLADDSPTLKALGLSDTDGRIKPSRQAKVRQVEEFLRILDATVTAALAKGRLRRPTSQTPWRLVDLGCGNAYLSFAALELCSAREWPVHLIGVDSKAQSLSHNREVAEALGASAEFVQADISSAQVDQADIVMALHACDTATDDALARAMGWAARVVLAAPCCHHDVAAQLRRAPTPAPYGALTRDGILRERLADTLTDALRAQLLRLHGYRVDVVEFVGSQHTPRNTLIRAVRTGAEPRATDAEEYDDLVARWRITPRLAELIS